MLSLSQRTVNVTVPAFTARPDTVMPFCANSAPPPTSHRNRINTLRAIKCPAGDESNAEGVRRIILTPDPSPEGEGRKLPLSPRERGLGGEDKLTCFFIVNY
jgi:hypothetical protein